MKTNGASGGTRPHNLLITRQLLRLLSHRSMVVARSKTLTTNVLFSICGSHDSAIQII